MKDMYSLAPTLKDRLWAVVQEGTSRLPRLRGVSSFQRSRRGILKRSFLTALVLTDLSMPVFIAACSDTQDIASRDTALVQGVETNNPQQEFTEELHDYFQEKVDSLTGVDKTAIMGAIETGILALNREFYQIPSERNLPWYYGPYKGEALGCDKSVCLEFEFPTLAEEDKAFAISLQNKKDVYGGIRTLWERRDESGEPEFLVTFKIEGENGSYYFSTSPAKVNDLNWKDLSLKEKWDPRDDLWTEVPEKFYGQEIGPGRLSREDVISIIENNEGIAPLGWRWQAPFDMTSLFLKLLEEEGNDILGFAEVAPREGDEVNIYFFRLNPVMTTLQRISIYGDFNDESEIRETLKCFYGSLCGEGSSSSDSVAALRGTRIPILNYKHELKQLGDVKDYEVLKDSEGKSYLVTADLSSIFNNKDLDFGRTLMAVPLEDVIVSQRPSDLNQVWRAHKDELLAMGILLGIEGGMKLATIPIITVYK